MIRLLSVFFHPTPMDYEKWLEKMALRGWYPRKINKWSSVIMFFDKKNAKKYRYVLDLQTVGASDYIKAYEAFGWELCGEITNAFLWRMEYEKEPPESFTDKQTLRERNLRFGGAMTATLLFQILIEILITAFFFINRNVFDLPTTVKYIVVLIISYLYTAYLGKILLRIRREGDCYGKSTIGN